MQDAPDGEQRQLDGRRDIAVRQAGRGELEYPPDGRQALGIGLEELGRVPSETERRPAPRVAFLCELGGVALLDPPR